MKKSVFAKTFAWILTAGLICSQNTSYVLAAQESSEEDHPSATVSTQAVSTDDVDYKKTVKAAGAVLREAMKERQETVTVGYVSEIEEEDEILDEIYQAAVNHTGDPKEGDYLRFQCGGYETEYSIGQKDENYYYTITYTLNYYTTMAQEEVVDQQVNALVNSLGLDGESDYDKVCKIYDYICENVSYDDEHLNDDSYTIKNTAYGALIDKTAVCQGYAVLFYRLALECGVDTRVISGTGNGEPHAWDIVRLNNYYYNVDPTWDAQTESHREYFLKGDYNFSGEHDRDQEYKMSYFCGLYPENSNDYRAEDPEEGPGASGETSGKCGDNLTYTYDSEKCSLTIQGTGAMDNYNNIYDFAPWYSLRRDIVTIIVSDGVTSIGNYAFASCASVESITLPDSIIQIGQYGFECCTALKKVTLPSKLERIDEWAFAGCKKLVLASGTLPSTLTYLGECAFDLCRIPQKIEIPSGVTEIGEGAFYDTKVSEVVIQGEGVAIKDEVFFGCSNLTNVTINGSVSEIGYRAFYDTSVEELDCPKGLVSIGDEVFNWSSLSKITLPEGLKSIGERTFEWCDNLKELSIPSTVTSIGVASFPFIETLTIDEKNTSFSAEDGILYNYDKTEILFGFNHITDETFRIRDGVTKIDTYAFYESRGVSTGSDSSFITKIIFPDSLKEIGDSAFDMMLDVESMEFGEGLESIGSYAFRDMRNLEIVYFAGNFPKIAENTFDNTVFIGYYPEGWDESALPTPKEYGGYIYWLKNGEPILPRSGICGEDGNNVTWTIDTDGTMSISGSGNMADYSKDFLEFSPWHAFRKRIEKVVIEDGVTSVGAYAFYDTGTLKEVSLGKDVEAVEEGAFSECPWIRSVELNEGLETIGTEAFFNSLEDDIDVLIPSTVTYIGNSAFSVWGTTYPINIWFQGELPELGERALLRMTIAYCPDSWESIPEDEHVEGGFVTYRKVKREVFEQVGKPITLSTPVQNKSKNTPNGVRLSWNAVEGATGYVVYRCEDFGPEDSYQTPIAVYLASTKDTTYLDTDVTSGDFLQYYVTAYNDEGVSLRREDEQFQQITYLSQALITSIKNVENGISLSWNAVSGAQTYNIYRKSPGEAWQRVGIVFDEESLTFTDELTHDGVQYTYGVAATFVDSDSDYETNAKTITRIVPYEPGTPEVVNPPTSAGTTTQKTSVKVKAPKLTSVKNVKGKKLTAKWTKNTSADGYQVQYSTKTSFSSAKTVTVKKGKSVSKTISKLKKNKKYYVRVRAYKTVGKIKYYSSWSNKKSVKIKK